MIPGWAQLVLHAVASFIIGAVGALSAALANMKPGDDLSALAIVLIIGTGASVAAKDLQSRLAESPMRKEGP